MSSHNPFYPKQSQIDKSRIEKPQFMSDSRFILLMLAKYDWIHDDLMHQAIILNKRQLDLARLSENTAKQEELKALEFVRGPHLSISRLQEPMDEYNIPARVERSIEAGTANSLVKRKNLRNTSYEKTFNMLLWIEEAQEKVEFRRFSRGRATPVAHGDSLYRINVPNLFDGRLSLLRGNMISFLRQGKEVYKGYVVLVRQYDVLFKLTEGSDESNLCSTPSDAQFYTLRINHRRCHHAISQFSDSSLLLERMLFPKLYPDTPILAIPRKPLKYFDQRLDDSQRRAVENIVSHDERPTPYLIRGGIGTGKTTTICEAILQVYTLKRYAKILVCGNSNTCADLLAKKLSSSGVINKGELARLTSSYQLEHIRDQDIGYIVLYSTITSETMLSQYRILVSSLYQPSFIRSLKFDYVFVDSANYVSEPKIMIALTKAKPRGSIVLSGDTKQPGPTCYSTIADTEGLGISLFERLNNMYIYQHRMKLGPLSSDDRYMTNLSNNYRSDPRLAFFNSKVFYRKELKFVVKTPEKYMRAIGVTKPVVFHNVNGQDRQDEESPSFYNISEATVCICYAIKLYDAGLEPGQLGILTPFKRQAHKLRLLFEIFRLKPCKIGTLYDFVNDEREVMIISTVRTREELLDMDVRTQRELTSSPKRFNVATSRAKWMNIVVGREQVLGRGQYWIDYLAQAHSVPSHDSLFEVPRSGRRGRGRF